MPKAQKPLATAGVQLPDLVVRNIGLDPANNVLVTVTNIGKGRLPNGSEISARVNFKDDDHFSTEFVSDVILNNPLACEGGGIAKPGGSTTYRLDVKVLQPIAVEVIVNTDQSIKEENTINNRLIQEVWPIEACPTKQTRITNADPEPAATLQQPTTGHSIKVCVDEKAVVYLTPADIDELPLVNYTIAGKSCYGHPIIEAIKLARTRSLRKTNRPSHERRHMIKVELQFTKDLVNGKLILTKTDRGTYNLVSPEIPSDKWVIDVSELAF